MPKAWRELLCALFFSTLGIALQFRVEKSGMTHVGAYLLNIRFNSLEGYSITATSKCAARSILLLSSKYFR